MTASGRGSGDGRGAAAGGGGGGGLVGKKGEWGLFKEGRVRWGRFEHMLTQETDKWKVSFWIAHSLSFFLFPLSPFFIL